MLDLICIMIWACPAILAVALIGLAAMWFADKTDSMVNEEHD